MSSKRVLLSAYGFRPTVSRLKLSADSSQAGSSQPDCAPERNSGSQLAFELVQRYVAVANRRPCGRSKYQTFQIPNAPSTKRSEYQAFRVPSVPSTKRSEYQAFRLSAALNIARIG
ncbi:hypothetical protein Q31a_46630 [Aureliella helgolandensis]|uniref:Uncharacterized protein n=1 Tax=Aureliella helgolandensis TaxID=2527968 RepID=A0A518GCG3_9BACT|nr:hypothetical protein Q31a_46630 [Aureliella helgolandensis]